MRPAAPVPHVVRPRRARSRLGKFAEAVIAPLIAPLGLLMAFLAFTASRSLMAVGVTVVTGAQPGPSDIGTTTGTTYFATGLAERGSTTAPILIRSMAEYAEKLGARVSYGSLHDDLQTFFAEGGSRAYVGRVVGGAATVGTKTLIDRAGTPLSTVRIDAVNAGSWSTQLTVAVEDGTITDTFRLLVYLNGELVEAYNDVASPTALVTAVTNRPSPYITATNLGSATAAPNNNPKTDQGSGAGVAVALSAGADDRAAVVAGDYITALTRFTPDLADGVVAVPGQASSAVGAGLIAHAKAYRRIALLAPAASTSVANAKVAAAALRSTSGSEHAGLFYPWIKVPDGAGGVRTISPEGYIAAARARAILEGGSPARVPAGEIAVAQHVTGVELELTRAQIDDLVDDRVNSIRIIAGTVRNYGWRSLSVDQDNYLLLNGRDVLNYVAARAEVALEQFVWRPIDGKGHLFAEIAGELQGIVEPIRASGGLYERVDAGGQVLDPGYVIDTGPSVNTPQTIAANEVRAQVALRVSPAGELIKLTVTKVSFNTSL